jgi:hypothetical protein
MSRNKSSFYLYAYAKNSPPLNVGAKKNFHTMPKIVAICVFPYQSLENHALYRSAHQVMHKIWGRKKSPMDCILPNPEKRPFSCDVCLLHTTNPESAEKFFSASGFSMGHSFPSPLKGEGECPWVRAKNTRDRHISKHFECPANLGLKATGPPSPHLLPRQNGGEG